MRELIQESLQTLEGRLHLSTLLRVNFKTFIQVFFHHITNQDFNFLPFHNDIIQVLENLAFGKAKKPNLVINLPPRHGKSIISQYFIAWSYALNSQSNCIYTSFSDNLVLRFSKYIKDIIESDLYAALFNIKLSKTESGKRAWSTTAGGSFYASSQGGTITGMGAGTKNSGWGGCLVIDDPLKPNDARYKTMRINALEYYKNTLKSRKNKNSTPTLLIMQRLHQEDLVGYVLENEKEDFDIIKIPAFDEETNKTIWESTYSTDTALQDREVHPFYFYSQYQQEPIIAGGNIIKKEWFCYYDKNELPTTFYKVYQSWDTAFKTGQNNDYSVCTTWGIAKTAYGDKYYLIDMWRGKVQYPQLKLQFQVLQDKYNPNEVLIEDKASGQSLLQDLKAIGNQKVKGVKVDTDKEARVNAISSCFANGDVLFNSQANYLTDLENELITFPTGEHDDAVDSISQFLNYLTTNQPVKVEFYF